MTPYSEENDNLRQYLLGNLSEERQQHIEQRLFAESGVLEELIVSEDELIDDYVNDNLSDDNRLKFELHFLSSPERHQKLRFARALSLYSSNSTTEDESKSAQAQTQALPTTLTWAERFRAFWNSQSGLLRAAAALAVVALMVGAWWLFLQRTSSPRTFATLTLNASVSTRAEGAQASKVKLSPGIDALKISLMLPEQLTPAARYRVELLNDQGATDSAEIAGQDAVSVSVIIPAARLARGKYALKLFMLKADGTEQRINGSYYFTVE